MNESLPRFRSGQPLKADDLNRIVQAVERSAVVPTQNGKIRIVTTPAGRHIDADVNDTVVVEVTSTTKTDSLFPGKIQRWDGIAWVEGADVWVRLLP